MQNTKIRYLAITAVFAALITIMTAYVFHIPVPIAGGYIHLGDSIIYLVACLLPLPYCLIAGALGGALADIVSGFAIWSIPTMIIKMLNVLPFALICKRYKSNKILSKQTTLMTIVSGIVTILGYFIAECILYSVASATLSLIGNTIQAVASGIIFIVIAKSLDKINLKSKLSKGA